MASYFFDSSALVKRYVNEIGSVWVRTITDPRADNRIYIAAITHVEVVAAITRKRKGSLLSAGDAATAIARFEYDLLHDLRVFDLPPNVIIASAGLAAKHALRGYDAVQLGVALEINAARTADQLLPLILISADAELNAAAELDQLAVDDPNQH